MSSEKRTWLVVLLLALCACGALVLSAFERGAKFTSISGCALAEPAKFAANRVRLLGQVVQKPDGTYRIESHCVPADRPYMKGNVISMPLIWIDGERWPEGIEREGQTNKLPYVIPGGHVTGTVQPAKGGWLFKAEEYGRPVWKL